MSKKTKSKSVDRRNFLKGAAAGAALAVTKPGAAAAQQASPAPRNASAPVLARPAAAPAALPAVDEAKTIDRPGSDFMVDVIKSLGFEYMFGVPANTHMSLQQDIGNPRRNQHPEFILATNEDLAATMAHGYAKV